MIGAVSGSAAAYRIAAAGLVAGVPWANSQGARSSDTTAFKTATELARMIRDKEISSVELTQYFIDRIERFDETLNAVVVRDFDRAFAAARDADDALVRGELAGPLHGLPMTIKESYDIAGLPTTWGIPDFAENIAERDAAVVSRYKAAGAHFMGKTNVPFGLDDFQTYNEIYGTTNNPWNIELTPGGSSGGSAAALAAGLTGLDSGSDIGGSIRNPAHYCGIYGHKPTWGIVPLQGHNLGGFVATPDLAVGGPLARSAEDLALALDMMAGGDELNAPGWQLRLREPRAKSLKDFRVAVWLTDDISPVDQAIADRVQEVAEELARLGATVSDSARPQFSARDSHYTYANLLISLTASSVPDEVYEQNKKFAAGFSTDDMSPEAIGAHAAVLEHRSWLYHHNIRTQIRMQWKSFFEDWDIVICPIMVTTAFPHDHRPFEERTMLVNGVETSYFDQVFWAGLATLPYLPSTVFPTGLSENGLPIGLQAIGAEFADRTTIEFARLVTQELGGFIPPLGYED
jgi:amidase